MIRLSKFADYGIVLLTYIADAPESHPHSSRTLAEASHLPLPTVSKILKSLSRAGLLLSHRGKQGGYSLARASDQITVADMIGAIDGPIGMTECSTEASHPCDLEPRCPVIHSSIASPTPCTALRQSPPPSDFGRANSRTFATLARDTSCSAT